MESILEKFGMKKYTYHGGTVNHPCTGLICTIGWEFESNKNYVMVYFEHDPRNLGCEIANKDSLKEVIEE